MAQYKILQDENQENIYPITHPDAVRDEQGHTWGQIVEGKQDKLIAGEGISIAEDGRTISATGGESFQLINQFTTGEDEPKRLVCVPKIGNYKEVIIERRTKAPANINSYIDNRVSQSQAKTLSLCGFNGHYRTIIHISLDDVFTLTTLYYYNFGNDTLRLSYYGGGTCYGLYREGDISIDFYNLTNAPAGDTYFVYAK